MIIDNVVSGGPALKVPEHFSFGKYVLDKLKENCDLYGGETIAMINGDTERQTTYQQMLQDIVKIGSGLRSKGLKKGDVVAICSENCDEYYPVAVGAIAAGAVVTTLNVKYTDDEAQHVLNISKPQWVFCSEIALESKLKTLQVIPSVQYVVQLNGTVKAADVLSLSEVIDKGSQDIDSFEPTPVSGVEDTAFILYSSGTTGMPKGVMITHYNALHGCTFIDYSSKNKSKLLTITPWYHVYGLFSTLQYVLSYNLVVYFPEFHVDPYLSSIKKYQITDVLAVPPIVVFLAKSAAVQKYDLTPIQRIWCAAAPLAADTAKLALESLPNCKTILQGYGLTETCVVVLKETDWLSSGIEPGSCGKPLPGVHAKVTDLKSGEKLGPHQQGQICLKCPTIMKGYLNNEAATKEMLDEEGFIKTGDIGYYDNEGNFFVIDRFKELIKYKGHQVAPALVESVVLQHGGVAECGVVGRPDELAGELPTAFVVPKPGVTLSEEEILDYTFTRLSPVSRLRGGIIFVDKIPRNPSGKILRRELRSMLPKAAAASSFVYELKPSRS